MNIDHVLPSGHMKLLGILLVVFQLFLPAYGSAYFSELSGNGELSPPGFVCVHADLDSGHQSQDGHQDVKHCHELDAPYDIMPGAVLGCLPEICTIASQEKGALLPGYGPLIAIPPKHRV